MTSAWQDFLLERGARIEAAAVGHFGDAAAELRAARDGGIVAPLDHLGLIACGGGDAQAFLHGQLSNDVKQLTPVRSEYAAYCSAKGRMLANFLMWQEDQAYYLQLARSLLPSVQKRLGMFVLRAKVKLVDVSESRPVLGLAGRAAATALREFFPALPQQAHQVVRDPANGTLIALPGARFQLVAELESAKRLWRKLTAVLRPVGAPCWEWLEIRNGLPLITPATQEQFVPQMANMELIGAVNFQKGCYPGQEIVARTQYLGQLKRRMVLAHVAGEVMPQPGDELISSALDGQASGMVVNAQAAPDGGYDLLAVMQTASLAQSTVHFKSADGPALSIQPLPYSA
ncbi:MAG: folate-binding protein [Betaproteobacteria bacterium]|nr:MAG: folate-binding protein [Betaproteobacteria bacterium]